MSKDRKAKLSIEDLPNELLSRVLSYLSLNSDLNSVQLTSKRWHGVVDETIGREITITSLTTDDDDDLPYPLHILLIDRLRFDQISTMGVKTCVVDLTKLDMDNEKEPEAVGDSGLAKGLDLSFKFPHLLKNLYLNGAIRSDLFQNLLKDITNLTLLKINMFALSQLVPPDLKSLTLPSLKILRIGKCLKATERNFDDDLALPNVIVLLEGNRFPKLEQFDLRFPIKNFRDLEAMRAVLKFLSVHSNLRELYIFMVFPVQITVLRGFQDELEELTNFAKNHGNRGKLQICQIQEIRLHASYPQIQIWKTFLEQQDSLKSLTLRLGYLPSTFLFNICTKNKKSLEHLFLYKLNEIMDSDPGAIVTLLDCSVFSPANLQTLYAIGCDIVYNVKSLPNSISAMFLSGLITSVEVEHILFHLSNMQFVNLKNACLERQDGFGVSLEQLQRFLETRKVRRLILNGYSLNEDYPAEGMSNGDPENPIQLMKFHSWEREHMYLDWELDTYYRDKCYGLIRRK